MSLEAWEALWEDYCSDCLQKAAYDTLERLL